MTVQFRDRHRLDDRKALMRPVLQVHRRVFAIQSVKQLPGGVAQIEKWPAIFTHQKPMIIAHFQRGRGDDVPSQRQEQAA